MSDSGDDILIEVWAFLVWLCGASVAPADRAPAMAEIIFETGFVVCSSAYANLWGPGLPLGGPAGGRQCCGALFCLPATQRGCCGQREFTSLYCVDFIQAEIIVSFCSVLAFASTLFSLPWLWSLMLSSGWAWRGEVGGNHVASRLFIFFLFIVCFF